MWMMSEPCTQGTLFWELRIMDNIVITGLGCMTSLGQDKDRVFDSLMNGKNGINYIQSFDVSSYAAKTGGEVNNFERQLNAINLTCPQYERAARLLLTATREAIDDASLILNQQNPFRIALSTGTTLGGLVNGENYYRALHQNDKKIHPNQIISASQYAPNDFVMSELGMQGMSLVTSTACSASSHAIGYALELLQSDLADVVLAGGFEPMSELTFAGFSILRSITQDKIRPFDKNRSGLVLGEGAGMLVLERENEARQRGAHIYALLAGYGSSSDAYHTTAPHKEGLGAARAMRMALNEAQLNLTQIDYINAHGTATLANDLAETRAIKNVFGEQAYHIPISSIKSMIGHTLGAAGAIEAVATVLTIHNNLIPPTINYNTPDPACDLDYVPNQSREIKVQAALSNSFGFGGNNAVLAFAKPDRY